MVGSVKYPTVESLVKQLHELSVKQNTVEAAKAAPSSQNANVFAQSSQKGNQQPGGKKKKGKKGEGNQNKPKPTNINMVRSQTLLQTRNKNYEKETS